MAGGIYHAKKIVIDEATCLANKLQNGGASCPETQGKAIALIVKMITPLYEAEFVTLEECRIRHDLIKNNGNSDKKIIKLKLGPVGIEGNVNPILMLAILTICCFGGLIFILGKAEKWW
jgi:hypothetical protein